MATTEVATYVKRCIQWLNTHVFLVTRQLHECCLKTIPREQNMLPRITSDLKT